MLKQSWSGKEKISKLEFIYYPLLTNHSKDSFLAAIMLTRCWKRTAQHLEHTADNQYDPQARFFEYQYLPGQEMKAHVAKVKNLAHLLADAGVPLTERQIVTKIKCTLPQAYQMFVSSWRRVPVESQTIASLSRSVFQGEL